MSNLAILGGPSAITKPIEPFQGIGPAEADAAQRVLDRGLLSGFFASPRQEFFGGPEVLALEAAWRVRFGATHAVSLNSATSGLMAAVGAAGVGPGDEVLVPPLTMSATAVAPLVYGAVPVFVDVEPRYFCMDPVAAERAITPRTRAIIAVNLFGHPAELGTLRALADRHGICLIEDNAQGLLAEEDGRLCGTLGHIGVFSLNIHKHVQAGEGGVCVTNDETLATRMQLIRNHGENVADWLDVEDLTNLFGFNFRLPEVSAAIAGAQLSRAQELVDRCRTLAERLNAGLGDLPGIEVPAIRDGCLHSWFMWTARYHAETVGASRAAFSAALAAEGFPNAEGYVAPLYRLPLFQKRIAMGSAGFPFSQSKRTYAMDACPVAEDLHQHRILQLQPVSWDIDDDQASMLIDAMHKVHSAAGSLPEPKDGETP